MLLFKIIVISILFNFWFIHQSRMPVKLKIDYKPFNCDICLPMYVAAGLYFASESVINFFFVIIISATLSPFIKNFFINLYFKK